MLELYHFDRSTAAQRVRIALAEKKLEWKSRIVDPALDKREQHDPDYLKLNPRGVVPTLVHEGHVIRETMVILEYLEDVFSQTPLRPEDPVERAQMRIWCKLIDEGLHVDSRSIGICVVNRHVTMKADPKILEQHFRDMPETVRRRNDQINIERGLDSPLLGPALQNFKRTFEEMDAALAESEWLAGDTFSLADLSLVVYATRLESFQMAPLWDSLDHFRDWHERIKQRPSYIKGVTEWGDKTSAERVEYGRQALPKIRELWQSG